MILTDRLVNTKQSRDVNTSFVANFVIFFCYRVTGLSSNFIVFTVQVITKSSMYENFRHQNLNAYYINESTLAHLDSLTVYNQLNA